MMKKLLDPFISCYKINQGNLILRNHIIQYIRKNRTSNKSTDTWDTSKILNPQTIQWILRNETRVG